MEEKLLEEEWKREKSLSRTNKSTEKGSLASYIKINELRAKKTSLELKKAEIIKKTQDEIEKNKKEVERIKEDLDQLKYNRRLYRMKLKDFYKRVLGNDEDALILDKPLYKYIQGLWEIKEPVPFEMFTKSLDRETCEFLIQVKLLFFISTPTFLSLGVLNTKSTQNSTRNCTKRPKGQMKPVPTVPLAWRNITQSER